MMTGVKRLPSIMIYLNEKDIKEIGINWQKCAETIQEAVFCFHAQDVVQPIKPYLWFKNPKNRIISMPAFLGGSFDIAGIKWIASFPDNIKMNLPRASSIVVLNDSETGVVLSAINASLLSVIRTASVSALVIKYFLGAREYKKITIGIIGWGPIGQYHLKMCEEILGNTISKIFLYDLRNINMEKIDFGKKKRIVIAKGWMEAYVESDIFITCTVSKERYIDKKPKPGSLLLNVSLRDYKLDIFPFVKNSIIVDNWEEVCREDTDIETFHKVKGLEKSDTKSIVDIVVNNCLKSYEKNDPIMFNPMGMAIFDIAIAKYYFDLAKEKNIGLILD